MQEPAQQKPITESRIIGVSTPRVDGPLKTTGSAMYSSDHHFPGLVHAWPVIATIASGTVTGIDTGDAARMAGVLAIYTHENIGPLYRTPPAQGFSMILDEKRPPPLEDTVIRYYGQYVAVAVAQTVEQARAAAEAVKVSYKTTPHNVEVKLLDTKIAEPARKDVTHRGDQAAAFKAAPVTIDEVYSSPNETHNPIELHASVALYRDGKFTLYETSQAVVNHRDVMAAMLGVPPGRRAGDHAVPRLWIRRKALAVAAFAAGGRGVSQPQPAGEAGGSAAR